MSELTDELVGQYERLTVDAGFVRLPDRLLVSMEGADRHRFLHSFCTADILALKSGHATEAFVLNEKGKVLSHLHVLATDEALLLSAATRTAPALIQHLDKYLIREDVQLRDVSEKVAQWFVCGPQAEPRLFDSASCMPGAGQVVQRSVAGVALTIASLEIAGPGYWIAFDTAQQAILADWLRTRQIDECVLEALQRVRVDWGTPWFGTDILDSNLPQEILRDSQAISFNKGCYLGQETVARIDALGHVNQKLVKVIVQSQAGPVEGTELLSVDKSVGRLTSVSRIPAAEGWVALAMVRSKHAQPGTELQLAGGVATVL